MFTEQVDIPSLVTNLFFFIGVGGGMVALAGLLTIDLGAARRLTGLNNLLQKLIGFFIGFAAFSIAGFAIWNVQFYNAFEIPNPLGTAIEDWWIGGNLLTGIAQNVDPAEGLNAGLNTQQIFWVLLGIFAGFVNVLIHFAAAEKIKASAYYIISFVVGGITFPVVLWLTYGPVSPLTNSGLHDYFGLFAIYMLAGTISLILAWRTGKRPGVFSSDPGLPGDGMARSNSFGLAVVGLVLVLGGLPFVVLASGFLFPDEGYFGINMSDTSIGILLTNYFVAVVAGGLSGAIIGYMTKDPFYVLLGPLAGYVSGVPAFDIYEPWVMALVALAAPWVVYLVLETLRRTEIDDSKLVPLGLGAGIFGAIAVGLIEWGTPGGGFLGVEEGPFAFQNAEVNVWWQLVGIGVSVGSGALTMLVVLPIIERTVGLRIPEADELAPDLRYWNTIPEVPLDPMPPEDVGVSRRQETSPAVTAMEAAPHRTSEGGDAARPGVG